MWKKKGCRRKGIRIPFPGLAETPRTLILLFPLPVTLFASFPLRPSPLLTLFFESLHVFVRVASLQVVSIALKFFARGRRIGVGSADRTGRKIGTSLGSCWAPTSGPTRSRATAWRFRRARPDIAYGRPESLLGSGPQIGGSSGLPIPSSSRRSRGSLVQLSCQAGRKER